MIPDFAMPQPQPMVQERLKALLGVMFVGRERTANMPIPAVLYAVTSPGQTLNAPTGWTADLDITVHAPADTITDIVKTIYAGIHAWKGTTSPHGHVVTVTDTQVPAPLDQTTVSGKPIEAYRGSWRLVCRTITN